MEGKPRACEKNKNLLPGLGIHVSQALLNILHFLLFWVTGKVPFFLNFSDNFIVYLRNICFSLETNFLVSLLPCNPKQNQCLHITVKNFVSLISVFPFDEKLYAITVLVLGVMLIIINASVRFLIKMKPYG